MEMIEPLWSFAADWKVRILVLAAIANMALAVRLYTVMSSSRMKAAKEGRVTTETYKATQNEPEDVAVFNRAVSNQFESPVLFYAVLALGLALGVSSWLTVVLAVIYVVLRYMHANEMIGEHNVLRRRKLFIYGFQALIVMMLELAVSTLLWA